jgi:hypothetical protein
MKGGKLSTKYIKEFLKQSYHKKLQNIGDYDVDHSLSGQRVQVYKHKYSPQTVVVHRGTKGLQDVYNDVKYALGMNISNSKRLKYANDIQKKAEQKYGKENITTLGHSLGSHISSSVGKDSKEVINLNKPIGIQDLYSKPLDSEYNVRTTLDPVSFLLPYSRHNNDKVITIPSKTINPLEEHKTDVLDRLPVDTMIGQGIRKLAKKDLKHIIKHHPHRHLKPRCGITGKTKKELIDFIETHYFNR